jgi:hypothetical protein
METLVSGHASIEWLVAKVLELSLLLALAVFLWRAGTTLWHILQVLRRLARGDTRVSPNDPEYRRLVGERLDASSAKCDKTLDLVRVSLSSEAEPEAPSRVKPARVE